MSTIASDPVARKDRRGPPDRKVHRVRTARKDRRVPKGRRARQGPMVHKE